MIPFYIYFIGCFFALILGVYECIKHKNDEKYEVTQTIIGYTLMSWVTFILLISEYFYKKRNK